MYVFNKTIDIWILVIYVGFLVKYCNISSSFPLPNIMYRMDIGYDTAYEKS